MMDETNGEFEAIVVSFWILCLLFVV